MTRSEEAEKHRCPLLSESLHYATGFRERPNSAWFDQLTNRKMFAFMKKRGREEISVQPALPPENWVAPKLFLGHQSHHPSIRPPDIWMELWTSGLYLHLCGVSFEDVSKVSEKPMEVFLDLEMFKNVST